uniref:Uncharacterized protein n=1 Tax=Palpitomonas bilix TaxID=652834 RepID=A0A7S3DAI9_9EUKA
MSHICINVQSLVVVVLDSIRGKSKEPFSLRFCCCRLFLDCLCHSLSVICQQHIPIEEVLQKHSKEPLFAERALLLVNNEHNSEEEPMLLVEKDLDFRRRTGPLQLVQFCGRFRPRTYTSWVSSKDELNTGRYHNNAAHLQSDQDEGSKRDAIELV